MNNPQQLWSDERKAYVAHLWPTESGSVIAVRLGTTKNAIIGIVRRMGLPQKERAVQRKISMSAGKGIPKPRKNRLNYVPRPKDMELVSLADLESKQCRWPSGHPGADDFGFCGQEVQKDQPYCAEHCDAAYETNRRASGGKVTFNLKPFTQD